MRGILHHEDFGWSNVPRGGGGGTTTSTNTTNSATTPWTGQQPYLSDLFSSAQGLYKNTAGYPQYYPTSTVSPLTSEQNSLIAQLENFGSTGSSALGSANSALTNTLNQGTNLTSPGMYGATATDIQQMLMGAGGGSAANNYGQAQGVYGNELSSGFTNPWNSGSFQDVVNNTLANAIPAATSGFIGGGRADSGLAARAASEGATSAVGQLAQNQYNTNQNLQQNAAQQAGNLYMTQQGLTQSAAQQAAQNFLNQQQNVTAAASQAPQIDTTYLNDLTQGYSAASQTQAANQAQLTDAVNRWNYNQTLPWNMLSQYGNTVGSQNYGSSTTSSGTSTQPYYDNTLATVGTGLGTAASVIGAALIM